MRSILDDTLLKKELCGYDVLVFQGKQQQTSQQSEMDWYNPPSMIIFVPKYKLSTVALSQAMKMEFKNLKSRARARAGTYLRANFPRWFLLFIFENWLTRE